MDKELCELKTCYEAKKHDLEDLCNDLIKTHSQLNKYKEEWKNLCKLVEYWKQIALEKGIHKTPVTERTSSHPHS